MPVIQNHSNCEVFVDRLCLLIIIYEIRLFVFLRLQENRKELFKEEWSEQCACTAMRYCRNGRYKYSRCSRYNTVVFIFIPFLFLSIIHIIANSPSWKLSLMMCKIGVLWVLSNLVATYQSLMQWEWSGHYPWHFSLFVSHSSSFSSVWEELNPFLNLPLSFLII